LSKQKIWIKGWHAFTGAAGVGMWLAQHAYASQKHATHKIKLDGLLYSMKITTTRRISQIFFFALFLWFPLVTVFGTEWWQLRGWPINLFLQLDPLAAIGTILTTHELYAGLLWALVTVILTIFLGRFFCSWLCPFGSLHHFISFLAIRRQKPAKKIDLNRYRKAQSIKYYILFFMLVVAVVPLSGTSLQTGLLDPIPLITRSVNLLLLPIIGETVETELLGQRLYEGAWLILTIFFAALLANLFIPRFYCRFICPLGALFGILSRYSIWRISKNKHECSKCMRCEQNCQGGCNPADKIHISECVLCFNCRENCDDEIINYQTTVSASGEFTNPDLTRRGIVMSLASGVFALPAARLSAQLGQNYPHNLIRPPGSLPEEQFLQRCIKCGQCMRVCPTNVLQPAGLDMGFESLWTPKLNSRIGTSGCQLNCVACGHVCPTAAIRPISLDEKLGKNKFEGAGPIKIGTAFIDQSRCLPWAMDKPCIVCQENCPVSPKAIYTRTFFSTIRDAHYTVANSDKTTIQITEKLHPDTFATGDYYCKISENHYNQRLKIVANTESTVTLSADNNEKMPPPSSKIEIQVRLQRPYIDIEKCIGCGICQHECPVSGKKAIRVSAEGESRTKDKILGL